MWRHSLIHGSDLRDAHMGFSFRQGTIALCSKLCATMRSTMD
jgi:hypothetical protein